MKKAIAYEIINHGPDHSQYFQGCGTYFTDYDLAVTGAGINAKEAYEDAADYLYMMDIDRDSLDRLLPTRPRGIRQSDSLKVSDMKDEYSEIYWYVSIWIKLK